MGQCGAGADPDADDRVTRRWYRGLPRVRVDIDCTSRPHHVSWKRGRLAVEDHDVAAELAVEALGGDRPPCVALYSTWRELCSSSTSAEALLAPVTAGLSAGSSRGRRRPGAVDRALDGLPEPLRDVMALIALVRGERAAEGSDPPVPTQVHRLISAHVGTGMRRSLGAAQRSGGRTVVSARLTVAPLNDEPAVDIAGDRRRLRVALSLPARWLVEVAGRGAASIGDRFVLRLRPPSGLAVRWLVDGTEVVPTLVELRLSRAGDRSWVVDQEEPATTGAFWSVRRGR
jgi:hypothetical protein